ncbi:hypothetical protein FBU30_007552 [Linnemannia zychae]|nr:hypothetical protein FBU30_007552 [Linnemannia zychae]
MPGIRHYNQGTEETTGRPITPATTTSRPAQNTASKNQNNANNNNASNNNGSNNPNSNNSNTRVQTSSGQSTTAPHQSSGSSHFPLTPSSWSSQPPTPPTPTQPNSFNRSTVNSTTIAAAAKNARNRGEDDEKSASTSSSSTGRPSRGTSSSSGSTVGAGTPTSALLFSTSQEFHQIWSQTTAFLYRTFSPTYRVGHLYLDSWTNGTQRRGFEKLKASVLRGDAFQLMQSTITQLQNFWNRTVAENKAHAGEVRRQAKAIEDKRKQIQEHTFKSSSSSTSTSKSSSQTGHKEGKQDTNNDSNSKT